jgi:hypothetical protein
MPPYCVIQKEYDLFSGIPLRREITVKGAGYGAK